MYFFIWEDNVLDIISEILNAEKLAEEKLKEAEEKSRMLLKECDEQNEMLQNQSAEKINNYEAENNMEADKKIMIAEDDIKIKEQEIINKLDKIYEENHNEWEKDITDRIVTV